MPDTLQNGRFVLLGVLGEGGQGRTFDAVDKREGRAVAVKRFDVRTARTWKDAELAEREARVLQLLSHPQLPRYVDHFEEDGALYLVMEKIEGETVASLRKRSAATEEDVVRLLRDASEILDYLHRRSPPIIHRDLKPGNVLKRPDGSFAFVDFGAVRDKLRAEGGSTIVGTFGYMAPEQFQGRALPASDVYAIGATAVALLTGREPETLPHRGLGIDVHAALDGRVRPSLVTVLARMLDPDPDKRAARIAPLLAELNPDRRSKRFAEKRGPLGSSEPWQALWQHIPDGLERQAREYERRAAELEQRAALGGPGAAGWRHAAKGMRRGAEKCREAAQKVARKEARRAARRAAHEARHVARRVEGMARHAQSQLNFGHEIPWVLRLAVVIGLSLAMLAVAVATRIVVPVVLTVLSFFFAPRGLLEARARVRAAGRQAVAAMAGSRETLYRAVSKEPVPEAAPRVEGAAETPGRGPRVSLEGAAGRRVDGSAADLVDDDEAIAAERSLKI